MPVFITYAYQIAGEADLKRSMSSVAAHAEKENNRAVRSQTRARQSAIGAANSNASTREAEKAELARVKAAEKADRQAARTAVKEHEKAEREKTRITEKEARTRASAEESLQRQRSSSLMTIHRQHLREVAKAERDNEIATARHRASVYNTTRGVVGGTVRRVSNIASGASMVAGVGGVALATNALHEGMVVEKSAAGLANQMAGAGETPEQLKRRTANIVKQAELIKGASSNDVIGSARAFGGISGDYDLGLSMTKDLSEIALATDVGLEDISKVAGNAYMKVKAPGMSQEEAKSQTLEAVRTFAGQGNVGAVEIKDLAQYGGRLTAGAAKFEGSRLQNMKRMGTLAQVAVGSGSATDAAEATEAAVRFADDLTQHSDRVENLKLHGKSVSAFTDKGKTKLRGIKELIGDVVESTGGSLPQMQDIFGVRSTKMTEAFQQKYLEAENTNSKLAPEKRLAKGKAGRAAIEAEFDKFDKAALTEKDQSMRAEAALATTTGQLDAAMKSMNTALATELLPVMPGLIRSFAELARPLAEVVSKASAVAGWLAANPFAGFSALISAAFLNQLAAAKIGDVIKRAVLESTGGGGAPGKLGGAGVASSLAVGVATFSVASAVLNILDVKNQKDGERGSRSLVSQWDEFGKRKDEILSGTGTQQEKGAKLAEIATTARQNAKLTAESTKLLPTSVTSTIDAAAKTGAGNPMGLVAGIASQIIHLLESDTSRNVQKGAAEFDKQLAAEQMKAAKMMQAASEKIASGAGSSPSGNTPGRGNSPSPVKP